MALKQSDQCPYKEMRTRTRTGGLVRTRGDGGRPRGQGQRPQCPHLDFSLWDREDLASVVQAPGWGALLWCLWVGGEGVLTWGGGWGLRVLERMNIWSFVFFSSIFLGPCPQHTKVPGLGVK